MLQKLIRFIPEARESFHKGQMGKMAVLGGSMEYTGAPYFAAMSILKSGADLSYVFCPAEAAIPIKVYSPDLIVQPTLIDQPGLTKTWFSTMHSFVLGPGLGRHENVQKVLKEYLLELSKLQKPIVLDADALFVVSNYPDLIKGNKNCILTPNKVEFERLCSNLLESRSNDATDEVTQLSLKLQGVTVCLKGKVDIISNGKTTVICDEKGSEKRVGGQGDILSGLTSVFAFWFSGLIAGMQRENLDHMVSASFIACHVTRTCARKAFLKYGRAMLASNLLDEIGPVISELIASRREIKSSARL